jgi:hypothetical protein
LKLALKELNNYVERFASIVSNQQLWPQVKPSDSSIIPNEEHEKLLTIFDKYHTSDSTSPLFIKSGRGLDYWRLFLEGVKKPKDESVWETIQDQVVQDSTIYWDELSKEERLLGKALLAVKVKKEQKKVTETATMQLDDMVAAVNGNPDPTYRLKTAVDELRKIRDKVDSKSVSRINRYINKTKVWKTSQEYKYSLESMQPGWHLHIAVAEKGKDPEWKKEMIVPLPGREETLTWKAGDVVYIAIDSSHQDGESWGQSPRAKEILRDEFSIFKMEGEVTFKDIGKTVNIKFIPGLKDRLPEL